MYCYCCVIVLSSLSFVVLVLRHYSPIVQQGAFRRPYFLFWPQCSFLNNEKLLSPTTNALLCPIVVVLLFSKGIKGVKEHETPQLYAFLHAFIFSTYLEFRWSRRLEAHI